MTLEQNLAKEREVQEKIFVAINEYRSFRFNAGAGAGKTYALIESIKYILNSKQVELKKNNQKIICITYTNVAVNEIKERLGNTQFAVVSTIHEMLWEQIKLYQKKELIDLHRNKLSKKLKEIQEKIEEHKANPNFSGIFNDNLESFLSLIKETEELYYKIKEYPAQAFKDCYKEFQEEHPYLSSALKNVAKFKGLIELLYKEERYVNAIARIDDPQQRKKIKIQYDSKSNSDRLTAMKFSHDTLLEYSLSMIEKYPMLQRIIVDKYPYFFIDEYQDTHENVIKLVQILHSYVLENNAHQNQHRWLVGYFGDTKQNIYDDGVGSNIQKIHPELENIDKVFNRRAHLQLINVINKIRDDKILQEPIDPNSKHGNVQFSYLMNTNEENKTIKILEFIEHFKNTISLGEKIDCLVPLNRSLASLGGFENIYKTIGDIIYWKDLNSQLLSHQLEKLHPTVLIFYHLVMFYKKLNNKKTTYHDLLGKTKNDITFEHAKKVIDSFSAMNVITLHDLVKNISQIIQDNDPKYTNLAIKYCLNNFLAINYSEIKKYDSFYEYIKNMIYQITLEEQNWDETQKEENEKIIAAILNVNLTEWLNWVSFINEERNENTKVIYHTYHGTKGAEYDNVAIIMEHHFGSKNGKNKFKDYFFHIQSTREEQEIKLLDINYKKQLENTQNLIYVACSRAKKNLHILYLDDISEIKKGIELLFDKDNINVFK